MNPSVPFSSAPRGISPIALLYGPGGMEYTGPLSSRPAMGDLVAEASFLLIGCRVSATILELVATSPVDYTLNLDDWAGESMALPITEWIDAQVCLMNYARALQIFFSLVCFQRVQGMIAHVLSQRSAGVGPTSVNLLRPWLASAHKLFFVQVNKFARSAAVFNPALGFSHEVWLESILPPFEKPADGQCRACLKTLWRKACSTQIPVLDRGHGRPRHGHGAPAGGAAAGPSARPLASGAGGGRPKPKAALPTNPFGDTIRADKVPHAPSEKTKAGGKRLLCVRASLASTGKCPLKTCSFSHERPLTEAEKQRCLYFAATSMPTSPSELKD